MHRRTAKIYTVLALLFTSVLTSCEDDFTPNAEWKNTPSVYCLLDQDDDTTFVRLQRCYLSDNNLYDGSGISDSIYYPDGAVTVVIKAWHNEEESKQEGATPVKTLTFNRMLREKSDGAFAHGPQPIYCHANMPGDLDTNYYYQLVITDNSSGNIIASAGTTLIGDANTTHSWLKNPFPVGANSHNTFNMLYGYADIKWYPFARGRLYQPRIRFYYRYRYDSDSLRHIDITCDAVKQTTQNIEMSTRISKEHYNVFFPVSYLRGMGRFL